MDSNIILRIHTISVMLFLLSYLLKTIFLLSSRSLLDKYTRATKVPEMIISFVFLVTGIWLFVIIGGIKTFQIIKLICVFLSIPLAVIGFKKYKKGLALISLMLIVAAYGLAEMSRNKPFIASKAEMDHNNTNAGFSNGAVLYQSNCVFCHGKDGKKMYRGATDLTVSTASEEGIISKVKDGSEQMPAYKGILSEQELTALAVYVKGIRVIAGDQNDTIR
jgi:mono/diheme cytochrome c family protein